MTFATTIFTYISSLLTIAAQVAVVLAIIALILDKVLKSKLIHDAVRLAGKFAMPLAFLIVVFATLGSLFYSDIAGFAPCNLCWFARILMYPLVVVFGVELFQKKEAAHVSGLIFSGIGVVLSLYQYLAQTLSIPLNCGAEETGASCSEIFFTFFGYVTIPMMTLTAFVLIFMLMILHVKRHRE